MDDSEKYSSPFLGIGWLSGVEEEHVGLCLLLLEIILFTLLEGVSWYLLSLGLFIYFWSSFKHQGEEIVKKLTLFLVPKVEEGAVEEFNTVEQIEVKKEEKVKPVISPRFPAPDVESVGWINDVIEKLWSDCLLPMVSEEKCNNLLNVLAEEFEDDEPQIANLLRQVSVEKVNIGSCPLRISRIVSHTDARDGLKIDVSILYPGNAELVLKWNNPELYAIGRNLGFSLSFQVAVGPIHRDLSILGGLSFSLLEQPIVMLDGSGLLYCPVELVKKVINTIMKPILNWLVLDPRCVSISFSDGKIHWPQLGQPAGIVRIFLVEGRDLVAADRSLLGACGIRRGETSDPFCKLQVDRVTINSTMARKTTNPAWNFYAEFPILSPGPSGQELVIEVFDKDYGAESDSLGGTSVDLGSLDLRGRVSDSWLDVETVDASSGQIRVRLQWVPCLPLDESRLEGRNHEELSSKAILIVHIKSIQTNSKVEPMISLQVSGDDFHTTTKGEFCQEYDFEEEMMLLEKDPDSEWISFSLFDLSKEAFNAGRLIKKGLSVVHSKDKEVFNCDSLAHKGNKDINSLPMVGDLSFPVRMFIEEKEMVSRMRSKTETEARISFTAKLFFLKTPAESLGCGEE